MTPRHADTTTESERHMTSPTITPGHIVATFGGIGGLMVAALILLGITRCNENDRAFKTACARVGGSVEFGECVQHVPVAMPELPQPRPVLP